MNMGLIRETLNFTREFFGSMEGVAWVLFAVFVNYCLDFLGLAYFIGINLLVVGLPAGILFRRLKSQEAMQAQCEVQITSGRQQRAIDSYVVLLQLQAEKQRRKRNIFQKIWEWF
jgi:hypothetical protein